MPFWILSLTLRHLRFRSGRHSVQWMTMISFVSVTIISACSILIQSVMNGLTFLVIDLYQSTEPDIRITHATKMFFEKKDFPYSALTKDFVLAYAPVYEKKALIKNEHQSFFVKVCCVGSAYIRVVSLDTLIREGNPDFRGNFLYLGKGLADALGLQPGNTFHSVSILAPEKNNEEQHIILRDEEWYRQVYPPLKGFFSLNDELDFAKIYISDNYVHELFSDSGYCSSIHLKVQGDPEKISTELQKMLGSTWNVQTRNQTHQLLVKTLQTEKEITFYILIFVLGIALITIIGSITMLILEKKKDIFILYSLGARLTDIKKIFILDGVFITLSGGLTGMALGLILTWIQQTFHLIPFGEHFIISYYPVSIQGTDVIKTLSAIIFMSMLAGIYPSQYFISENALKYSLNRA